MKLNSKQLRAHVDREVAPKTLSTLIVRIPDLNHEIICRDWATVLDMLSRWHRRVHIEASQFAQWSDATITLTF